MLPLLVFALLVVLFWIGNPLLFLLFPGAFCYPFFRKTASEQVVYCLGCSLAFWIISAWFVKLFGFSYFSFATGILILSICAFPIVIKRYPLMIKKEDVFVFLFFLFVLGIRLIPMTQFFVAPGNGDMSEHTYPVVLILWNQGIPDSYKPLLPLEHFGAYAAGFHTIAALFSWFSMMPEYQATFLLSVLAHGFVTLGLYVFLRLFFSWQVAGITSFFASFLTTYPQLIFHWGGNPTVLSFFFVLLFAAVQLNEQRNTFFSALFLVASLLTHVVPFLSMFYSIAFVYVIFFVYLIFKKESIKPHISHIIIMGCIMFFLLLPYLYYLHIDVMGEKELFQKVYYSHAAFPAARLSLVGELLALGPVQSIAYTSIPLFLAAISGWYLLWKQSRKLFFLCVSFFFAVCLLLINIKFWILPFTYAFRSDRVSMLFLLPYSFFAATLIKRYKRPFVFLLCVLLLLGGISFWLQPLSFSISPYAIDRTQVTISHAARLGLFQFLGGPAYLFLSGMHEDSLVTQEDLDAFLWIRENTPKDALFLNNKIDAGTWISAIAYRPIVLPQVPGNFKEELLAAHNLSKFMKDEPDPSLTRSRSLAYLPTDAGELRERNISYVYIGKKYRPEPYPRIAKEDFVNNPEFEVVYDKGNVVIFKVL